MVNLVLRSMVIGVCLSVLVLIAIHLYRRRQTQQLGYYLLALAFPAFCLAMYQYETYVPQGFWTNAETMRRHLDRRSGPGQMLEFLSTAIVFFGPGLWLIAKGNPRTVDAPKGSTGQ